MITLLLLVLTALLSFYLAMTIPAGLAADFIRRRLDGALREIALQELARQSFDALRMERPFLPNGTQGADEPSRW